MVAASSRHVPIECAVGERRHHAWIDVALATDRWRIACCAGTVASILAIVRCSHEISSSSASETPTLILEGVWRALASRGILSPL